MLALAANVPAASGSTYSLHAVNFDRTRFGTAADCLTAASARLLPLDICH
jgi:hypothetical protein